MSAPSIPFVLHGVAPLAHLGVIQIEGEEAAKFIHGQLTQDFALLDQGSARLAAFCNPKGRMQASFIGFKRPNGVILLVCSRDLLAPTVQRLSMFVMRAKAKLSDVSDQFQIFGLAGDATISTAGHAHTAWTKFERDAATVVTLYPAAGAQRQMLVAPIGRERPQGPALSTELWDWGDVRSGVATLTLPVWEAFVPQMLNYESVGGVSFKKGCYPGQEVVARSQFRGTLKRRAFIAHCNAHAKPGDEVFSPDDANQPVGTVVQSAPAPESGWDAIVSLQVTAATSGALHLGAAEGPVLQLLPLPYPLLDDI